MKPVYEIVTYSPETGMVAVEATLGDRIYLGVGRAKETFFATLLALRNVDRQILLSEIGSIPTVEA